MKKILYVLNSNGVGGAETMVTKMVKNYFSKADIATLYGHKNVNKSFWNFKHQGDTFFLSEKKLSLFTLFFSLKKLKDLIKNESYSVIQTQLKGADIVLGILRACGFIDKNILLISGIHSNYTYYYAGSRKNKIIGFIHSYILKRYFDKIIGVSTQNYDNFVQLFGNKYLVIENSIELDVFRTKENQITDFLQQKSIQIGMVGNIKKIKGYASLIKLSSCLEKANKRFAFNIAGSIEDEFLCNSIINSCSSCKNIEINFKGKITNINEFLLEQNLFLSLSTIEGMPVSVLEACATKIPILLSNIEGHSQLVEPSLIENIIFDSLEDLCDRLINIHKFIDSESVEKQYSFIEKKFNFENMCKKYEEVYEDVK